jgi:hypothetical protein
LRGIRRGRRNIELGQLTGKERVLGELRDELVEFCADYIWLSGHGLKL